MIGDCSDACCLEAGVLGGPRVFGSPDFKSLITGSEVNAADVICASRN